MCREVTGEAKRPWRTLILEIMIKVSGSQSVGQQHQQPLKLVRNTDCWPLPRLAGSKAGWGAQCGVVTSSPRGW